MITEQNMRTFLREIYRHDHFEGRDGPIWGEDYSARVVKSTIAEVERSGIGLISRHDAVAGIGIFFAAGDNDEPLLLHTYCLLERRETNQPD